MIHGRQYDESGFLCMITKNGTVKRTELSEMKNIRTTGLRAITLEEGDELICVRETDGEMNLFIATHDGMGPMIRRKQSGAISLSPGSTPRRASTL